MSEAKRPQQIGHVIRILDKYTLIIDVGSNILKVGDTVQVYGIGDVINDLSGNPLSYFVNIKDELEVIQTEDTYSVCRKDKLVKKEISPLFISPTLEKAFVQRSPLNVSEDEISPIQQSDQTIHVGDAVKLA